ncbi:MAG: HDIG domain-containing protein, partial [Ignisphaera sp.]|nr:HDIG domain-containing protein [Ignisphaera sp.]
MDLHGCRNLAAYYNGSGVAVENLVEHSLRVGVLASLTAKCIGLNPVLGQLIGLLHDIGKALSFYQRSGGGFSGHEALSAAVVGGLIDGGCIGAGGLDLTALKPVILYPILSHHQAHRSLSESIKIARKFAKKINIDEEAIYITLALSCILSSSEGGCKLRCGDGVLVDIIRRSLHQGRSLALATLIDFNSIEPVQISEMRVYTGLLM